VVEGWSPLGRGKLLDHELLGDIAQKVNRSVAQVCVRWAVQNKVVPLPKSATPHRIKENIDVFDFELSAEDMKSIDDLASCGFSGLDPDSVAF